MKATRWTLLTDRDDTFVVGQFLGRRLLERPELPRIIAAIGDLGAGKTSLAQGVARGLGVPSETYVNSPTFALHQVHQGQVAFHHLDLYRLMDEDELIHLGFEEVLDHGVSYIEWPQRAPNLIRTTPHFKAELFYLDEWTHISVQQTPDDLPEDGRILRITGSKKAIQVLIDDQRWQSEER